MGHQQDDFLGETSSHRYESAAEQPVQRALRIADEGERRGEMAAMGGQPLGGGKRDHGDRGVTEVVDAIAHGDHVLLARQSSEVTVQHQHERAAHVIAGAPQPTVVVDQVDRWEGVTDTEGHAHQSARVQPRRLMGGGWTALP